MLVVVVRQSVLLSGVVDPRIDEHEIGDEGRNLALQNGGITADDVLVFSLRNVVLVDNCSV